MDYFVKNPNAIFVTKKYELYISIYKNNVIINNINMYYLNNTLEKSCEYLLRRYLHETTIEFLSFLEPTNHQLAIQRHFVVVFFTLKGHR